MLQLTTDKTKCSICGSNLKMSRTKPSNIVLYTRVGTERALHTIYECVKDRYMYTFEVHKIHITQCLCI